MNSLFPRCTLRPLAPDEGEGDLIEFPDYPGCMADGPTPEAALREGYDALHSYLETLKALGHPLPDARRHPGLDHPLVHLLRLDQE